MMEIQRILTKQSVLHKMHTLKTCMSNMTTSQTSMVGSFLFGFLPNLPDLAKYFLTLTNTMSGLQPFSIFTTSPILLIIFYLLSFTQAILTRNQP